jgi:hypothetical protein
VARQTVPMPPWPIAVRSAYRPPITVPGAPFASPASSVGIRWAVTRSVGIRCAVTRSVGIRCAVTRSVGMDSAVSLPLASAVLASLSSTIWLLAESAVAGLPPES